MDDRSPTWRGTTEEERRAPRRARLLDAAFVLLGEHGVGGTTVRGVCAEAGLNARYFYESFTDLDELILAVYAGLLGEMEAISRAAIDAAEPTAEAKVRAALEPPIRWLAEDPRRARILLRESAVEPLAPRRAKVVRAVARNMAEYAAGFYKLPLDDKLLASSTHLLTGGLVELVVAWHEGTLKLTLDELVDHCVALTVATSRAAGALRSVRAS